jgi:DNA ligase 1
MQLLELVEVSRKVSEKSGRLDKIAALAACIEQMTPPEIPIGVAFLSGLLRQGRIGVGYAAIRDASPEAAEAASLGVLEVDELLDRIQNVSGRGSAGERARLLHELFRKATKEEQNFLARLLLGELRQGAQAGVMADAIARAARVPASSVRRAAMLSGDMSAVARAALTQGEPGLSSYRLELLRPVEPMLAQTLDEIPEAIERMGEVAAEYKLDGARIQLHRDGDDIRIFTRGLHDVTSRAPEIVELARALPVRKIVLDGEALALRVGGKPHPFQTTMRRFGRRLDVDASRAALPLTPFFFDCLHAEGEDLLDRPLAERFAALTALLPEQNRIPQRLVQNAEDVRAFADEALTRGHEGIMLKALGSSYEAGSRGAAWLKLKPAHTLDLVVLAVEWGSGRRQGWLSNLHLGARDPTSSSFVMLGKTFKGMTDQMLRWQTERLLELEIGREGHVVHVRPELVVEVAFDGVQQSPHYPGGLALRFARVKRYRPDKRADEADVIDTVRAIHGKSHGEPPG